VSTQTPSLPLGRPFLDLALKTRDLFLVPLLLFALLRHAEHMAVKLPILVFRTSQIFVGSPEVLEQTCSLAHNSPSGTHLAQVWVA
jgi:hypothetical protein